jgi:uncharacterized protein YqhQ
MEDNFKNILFAFIFMSLFGLLILTSVANIGNNYHKDTTEIVGGSLSISKFNESITDLEKNSKDLKERFDKQSIWSSITGIVVEGIFGIAKGMFLLILFPFDIIIDIMSDVFQVPLIVTSVLLGILILSIIFAIWRLLKIGD